MNCDQQIIVLLFYFSIVQVKMQIFEMYFQFILFQNMFQQCLNHSDNDSHLESLPGDKNDYICKINKYVCLGSGSFGSVHPGYYKLQNKTKIDVAVKIVNIKGSKTQIQTYQKILESEKKTYKQIHSSKYIVKLYSCIRKGNSIYFIMEKCDEDFATFWTNNYKDEKEIRYYFLQILLGYNELYRKKIMHHDIKPQNILVKDKSILKLADFGLTQNDIDNNPSFARNNRSWNTTSPEVRFSNCGKITHKSDVWSLGAVLYWMIYNRYPFGQQSSLEDYKIKPAVGNISDQLKNILMNTLELDCTKRWDFGKLISNHIFENYHFNNTQFDNSQHLQTPIFIQYSVTASCLDKRPSIEFYISDQQFYEDGVETKIKKEIKQCFLIIKTKINFISFLVKNIQRYSVYSLKNSKNIKKILLKKKILIMALKNYINYHYEYIISGEFLPSETYLKAMKNQQPSSYLSYLTAICKEQIRKWQMSTLQQQNLLMSHPQEMQFYQWSLRRNWKKTRQNISYQLQNFVRQFLKSLQKQDLGQNQYILMHYVLLVYQIQGIFMNLRDYSKCQIITRFLNLSGANEPSVDIQMIKEAISNL